MLLLLFGMYVSLWTTSGIVLIRNHDFSGERNSLLDQII